MFVVCAANRYDDDVSSTSSDDYEQPMSDDDRVTSSVTSRPPADDNDDDEEIYEDIEPTDPPTTTTTTTRPPASAPVAAAADDDDDDDDLIYEICDPVLPPDNNDNYNGSSEDYANLYYGRWDCVAPASGDELSFRRAEVLHVVSRHLDEFGWWVASSTTSGRVGLVPKQYLTPAYQLIN